MSGLALVVSGLVALVATCLWLIEIHTFPIVEDSTNPKDAR